MNVQALDYLLDVLSRAESMVPDPEDRAAVARSATVLRRLTRPPKVVLVVGDDVDPVVEEVQWQAERVDDMRKLLGDVSDGYADLLEEMRNRRQRVTQERESLRAQLAAMTSVARQLRDGTFDAVVDQDAHNPHECEAIARLAEVTP